MVAGKSGDQQVKHITSGDNHSARKDVTMYSPTWATIFTDDCIPTRPASGNQAEGQNSKDLADKVNSKNSVLSAPHLKLSIFRIIFQDW